MSDGLKRASLAVALISALLAVPVVYFSYINPGAYYGSEPIMAEPSPPAETSTTRPEPASKYPTTASVEPSHSAVTSQWPGSVAEQAEFIKQISSDREALYKGTASTRLFRSAETNREFPMDLRVCAPQAGICAIEESLGPEVAGNPGNQTFAAGSGPVPAPEGANKPLGKVDVGGRVRAALVSYDSAVHIEPQSDEVQLIVSPDDVGHWFWAVTARRPGHYTLRMTVTPLRGETEEALRPPTDFRVAITVNDTWGSFGSRIASYARDFLTSIGGVAASIITAIVGYLVYRRARRSTSVPADRQASELFPKRLRPSTPPQTSVRPKKRR